MSAAPGIAVVVRSAALIAQDVRQITLSTPDGSLLPEFAAGAHVDVHLGPGLVRQYSLCGSPTERSQYTIAIKLEPQSRGGSLAVHGQLAVGTRLTISPPRNNFPLSLAATHVTLVAGGIGITPLLAMARTLEMNGRPFRLHYFSRSPAHAAYLDLLETRRYAKATALHFGLSREETAASLDRALASPRTGAELYICGPRSFMDLARETAQKQGWPKASVRLEYFGAGEQAPDATGADLEVVLARSGKTVHVPAAVPIIDSLRACGVPVETSCEQGVCGTCITKVLAGTPDHRDLFLTDGEKARGDCMAICVSRALGSRLVLDM